MRVTIIDNSGRKYDTTTYLTEPMGGTETLASQLINYLRRAGVDVVLNGSVVEADVVLVLSDPSLAKTLRETKTRAKLILWEHQSYDQPIVQSLKKENLWDLIIFVSHWQKRQYEEKLGVKNGIVIRNAIEPISYKTKSTDKINLIYTSTPFRGLELLVPLFDKLVHKYNNLFLHVYSSMSVYQRGDKDFMNLYGRIDSTKNSLWHGSVGKQELYTALGESHIFAYPSIWEETSCLAAIEAMSANCQIVTTGIGALPETVGPFGTVCDIKDYEYFLEKAINEYTEPWWQKPTVDRSFGWETRIYEWLNILNTN